MEHSYLDLSLLQLWLIGSTASEIITASSKIFSKFTLHNQNISESIFQLHLYKSLRRFSQVTNLNALTHCSNQDKLFISTSHPIKYSQSTDLDSQTNLFSMIFLKKESFIKRYTGHEQKTERIIFSHNQSIQPQLESKAYMIKF